MCGIWHGVVKVMHILRLKRQTFGSRNVKMSLAQKPDHSLDYHKTGQSDLVCCWLEVVECINWWSLMGLRFWNKKQKPFETKNTHNHENRRLGLIESLHMQQYIYGFKKWACVPFRKSVFLCPLPRYTFQDRHAGRSHLVKLSTKI